MIRTRDAAAFSDLSHKTIGGLLQFGFVELPNHIRSLRHDGRIPDPEHAEPIRKDLLELLDHSLAALADWESEHWPSDSPAAVQTGAQS